MRIARIQISNFRNFSNFDIPVGNTVVLIGENNAGKSNLIYALRLLLDPDLPESARVLDEADFWEGLDHKFAGNIIEVTVDFTDFEDNNRVLSILYDATIEQAPRLLARLTFSFRPKDTKEIQQLPHEQLQREHYEITYYMRGDKNARISSEFRRWLPLQLLPALRDAKSDLSSWRRSPLRPLIDGIRDRVDEEWLKQVAQQIDELTRELLREPNIAGLQSSIVTRLVEMLGTSDNVDPALGFLPTDASRLLRLLRLFADGGVREIDEIGLGYSNVMYLVLLLLELERREVEADTAATILAIEEPEAHLHPHLQRMVFRDLLTRSASISVIMSTHSPFITSVTALDSIVLLRRIEGATQGRTILGAGLSEQELYDLQRYVDVTRTELFFSQKVILVEGISEEFLIPQFSRLLAKSEGLRSLDTQGVSIVNVGSTDFTPYVKLLGARGLQIPWFVITDGDPKQDSTGVVHYEGIERGKRILAIAGHTINENHNNDEHQLLSEKNIYVGQYTLEIDLVDAGCRQPVLEVFRELGATPRKMNEATELIDAWDTLPTTEKLRLLDLIDYLGKKGRFAQRLASKVRLEHIPKYILDALVGVMN